MTVAVEFNGPVVAKGEATFVAIVGKVVAQFTPVVDGWVGEK